MIRFDTPQSVAGWHAINDAVMGGASASRMEYHASGHAAFSGVVSFANNGGFASVRCHVTAPGRNGITGYGLTVRGEAKTYKLSLRLDPEFDGVSYQARFQPRPGTWTLVRLPVADFVPTWRGRPVVGAPLLDPAKLRQIGILIADRQEGPFCLEIRSIDALP